MIYNQIKKNMINYKKNNNNQISIKKKINKYNKD